jgi:threonine synthase
MNGYICPTCRARHAVTPERFRCDCGAPLALDFESAPLDREALGRRPHTLWRYREALPFAEELTPVTLGGGVAPVVEDVFGDTPVHAVLEYVSPTGSYKDRGASLVVSLAAALRATLLVDDTSGNAGIALAAHAARAGLMTRIFVPEDAAPAKPRIAAELGAEVVRVAGGRAGAAAAVLDEAASGAFYASHAWSPFFIHGAKTLAYSLSEALRWTVPGAVVVPVGNGGLVLGLDIGFRELRRHGLIERRPAIVAVQAAACAPLARAFAAGTALPLPVSEGVTAADGVRVCAPPRGAEVLEAVRQSGGSIEEAGEEEIDLARRALWRKGYAVESTGALAAACVFRLGDDLRRRHGDLAVVLSGSGLKL